MRKPLATLLALASLAAAYTPAAGQSPPLRSEAAEVLRRLLDLPAPEPRTTVRLEGPGRQQARPARPEEFYDDAKPPPDDAPAEDLLDYWAYWSSTLGGGGKPSDTAGERLLAACEAEPERLAHLLPSLPVTPEAAERVKKLYDAAEASARSDGERLKRVREWLKFNSAYFVEDLAALARRARDKGAHVENGEALKALARVDWRTAEPLLESLAAGPHPRASALALALLHRRAHDAKDRAAEEKYRARLLAVANDRQAAGGARDTAVEELSLTRWQGRDEWYVSLLEDETLLELRDSGLGYRPLKILFEGEPGRWLPVMAELVRGRNAAARNAAAQCLVSYAIEHASRDAVLPVLRWLSDPDWLDLDGATFNRFVLLMGKLDVPESVPGLISILENPELTHAWAALALARYRDPRAVPPLRKALAQEPDENYRQYLIEGLLASGGVAEAERLASLEAYAAWLSTAEGREQAGRYSFDREKPLPLPVSVGRYFARQKEAPDPLVRAVLARAADLRERRPALARALLEVAEGWQSRLVDLDVLRRIAEGTADAATVAGALEGRERLRESVGAELRAAAAGGGAGAGVASVLSGDEALARGLLNTGDELARLAVLACARLTQTPLPAEEVGALLKRGAPPLLRLAAVRYLLAEDGAEARRLLRAAHPGEAFITGWRDATPLDGGDRYEAMGRSEERLRAELFGQRAPLETYAMLARDGRASHVLRVYADRAVYTFDESDARTRERVVSDGEVARFKELISSGGLTEAGPQFEPCHHDCWASEFLWLSRGGGRRVFSHGGFGGRGLLIASYFGALGGDRMRIRYRLEDEVEGLEILFAEDGLEAKDVWQRGVDLRALFERQPTGEEAERLAKAFIKEGEDEDTDAVFARGRRLSAEIERARLSWRAFADGRPGATVARPEGYSGLDLESFEIDYRNFSWTHNRNLRGAVAGDLIVLAGNPHRGGLWTKSAGRAPSPLSGEGMYAHPLVTPDGRWVVAARAEGDEASNSYRVVRFDLAAGREHVVELPPAEDFAPVAYVAAHACVLLRRARAESGGKVRVGPESPEHYLLDPSTGRARRVEGQFEPLSEEGERFLQPTGRPDEYWAALPAGEKEGTRVGRYSLKDFTFRPLMTVPRLSFDSTSMWVDEPGRKLYVVYGGHLLRLPLPAP